MANIERNENGWHVKWRSRTRFWTNTRNYLSFPHCPRIIEDVAGHIFAHGRRVRECARERTRGRENIRDSPFAEGKSTNRSISSTNTDTGATIPFRRGNAGSCILENTRAIFIKLHPRSLRACFRESR